MKLIHYISTAHKLCNINKRTVYKLPLFTIDYVHVYVRPRIYTSCYMTLTSVTRWRNG